MSSLGDLISDIILESGPTDPPKDHGFAFWEFIYGLLKIVGIFFALLILLAIVFIVLEYLNIPIFEWLFGISYMSN